MKVFSVDLTKQYATKGGTLDCYVAGMPFDGPTPTWQRPAVIVVPGGAYGFVSKREGEPVAMEFLARGYHAFVLTYTIASDGARYPDQLEQVACAVDYVRKNAADLCVNPDEIFAVGFSAGGHLVGTLATQCQNVAEICGKQLDCRPTAVAMSYPVVSKDGHADSLSNLFGNNDAATAQLYPQIFDLSKGVTPSTPPTFLWHTTHDTIVDSRQSLLFANALANNGVHFELHVYPNGDHGMASCSNEINCPSPATKHNVSWLDFCAAFFRSFCKENF